MLIRIWTENIHYEKVEHNTANSFEEAKQVTEALLRLGYLKVWIEIESDTHEPRTLQTAINLLNIHYLSI